MTWNWMGPQFYLGQTLMLRQIGAITSTESVTLTLQDAAGKVRVREIDSGDFNIRRKLRPSPAAQGEVPLYLTKVDTEYWMQSFPEQRAVYFQFNQVRNGDDQSIEEFAAQLAERLDNEETKEPDHRRAPQQRGQQFTCPSPDQGIGDLRKCSAGQSESMSSPAATRFLRRKTLLTGLSAWTDAIFVGEPSSSSPNFVGEETNLLLPYSRVRGSISTRFWQDSDPGDNRAWITPAVPVKPTAAAYFANEDAAMDAIFEIITSELNH